MGLSSVRSWWTPASANRTFSGPASPGSRRRSPATRGELVPVQAEVNQKNGSQRKGDDADCGQHVAKMAPVGRHEIEHAAGDKGKGDGVGAGHPLAVHDDLAIARG